MDSMYLQSVTKGFSNHYRIEVLRLLEGQQLTLDAISELLDANYKTIGVHVKVLHQAGLISKKYLRSNVLHGITDRGLYVLNFLRKLERL